MTKMIQTLSLAFVALFAFAGLSQAQTATPFATLSTALDRGTTTITLSSNPSSIIQAAGLSPVTGLYVDREYMTVVANINPTNPGNTWTVKRGAGGIQTPHNASSVVFVGPTGGAGVPFDLGPNPRAGACTAGNFVYLPLIQVRTGQLENCVGGQWVTGVAPGNATAPYTFFTTLQTPVSTASVADISGKIWYSAIDIPQNAVLTGACFLGGSGSATDSWIVALYDNTGALVANSATAGTGSLTASVYDCIAFTSTVRVTGPQTYFLALQGNGTTASSIQTYATKSTPTNYGTGNQSGTFGTLASITPPTSFTASVGPLMAVY